MKKSILTIAFSLFFGTTIFAQTPIIKDFRAIIADRSNEFVNLQKALTLDNSAAGFKQYSSKIEDLGFNKNIIINGNRGAQYLVVYDLLAMSKDIKQFFDQISIQYFTEIDAMSKTGNYVVQDYKANDGTLITELKNAAGDKILEYRIKSNEHLLLFVGPKK
jgi:hypothetical protein